MDLFTATHPQRDLIEAAEAVLNSPGWSVYRRTSPFKELAEAVEAAKKSQR